MSDEKKQKTGRTDRLPVKPAVKLTEGSKKARKTAARLTAVQIYYQISQSGEPARQVLEEYKNHRIGFDLDGDVLVPADQELLGQLVLGLDEREDDVEQIVSATLEAEGKSLEKVEPLLTAILMVGAYELLAHTDTDAGIIIADYMNVTHGFYEGKEPKLVNAVLDKAAKNVRD